MEVFIDTIIINTITGLVIIIAGIWTSGSDGAALAMASFDKLLPGGLGSYMIMIASICFSFTCLTSSSYVCEESAEYLFGTKSKYVVKVLWLAFIIVGAFTTLDLAWDLADTANGLMAIPNLIGLLILGNQVVKHKKDFFDDEQKKENKFNKDKKQTLQEA